MFPKTLEKKHKQRINDQVSWDYKITSLLEVTPTNVSDDAPRLQVQQELLYLRPGFVAAVVEIWSDLVIDAVHMVSLELTGSLLHHVLPGCHMQRPHSIMSARTNTSFCSCPNDKYVK